MNTDHLIVRALMGKPCERTPVWVMRQAGRILPEYRAVRNRLSGFKELVKTPELAAEVTLQPVEKLGVDAAIIFSDILVIPEAMGLPYEMNEGVGPYFPKTIQNPADIDSLRVAAGDELNYVAEAISITRAHLGDQLPVIGFAGAPFTILCYMVEGKGSKTFSKARKLLYTDPKAAHRLMDKITESTINYLKLQQNAGVALYQVFDSWAGVLNRQLYTEFCLPYLSRIAEELLPLPGIVFAKGAFFSTNDLIANTNFEGVGLDWTQSPLDLKATGKTLQGNLDPCVLYADDEVVVEKTNEMLSTFLGQRHIANLGHGVYPDTDWQKVKLFVDTVKGFTKTK